MKDLSLKKIREICQKPVIKSNTWYQANIARRISIYLTWIFLKFKIHATPVSILMLIIGLISSYFFTFGVYFASIIAVILFQFWYVLDMVDGELARYWNEKSAKGSFLDKLDHHVVHPLIFIGISIGLYKQYNLAILLILGGFIAYSLLLQDLINLDKLLSVLRYRSKKRGIKEIDFASQSNVKKSNLDHNFFSWITSIFYKIPGMMNVITLAAIFNLLYYVFLFYAITLPIMVILKLIYNLNLDEKAFN